MFSDDYILRQIETLTRMLGQVLFQRQPAGEEMFDARGNITTEGLLLHKLKHMIAKGEINAAENFLFEEIESSHNILLLPAAVEFYKILSTLSEKRLQECDYSSEEIASGLQEVQRIFESYETETQ